MSKRFTVKKMGVVEFNQNISEYLNDDREVKIIHKRGFPVSAIVPIRVFKEMMRGLNPEIVYEEVQHPPTN